MNPRDANPEDWHLYYHRTWMLSKKHGPIMVYVDGTTFMGYRPMDVDTGILEEKPVKLDPMELETWWPRSAAYNWTYRGVTRACYLTRRAQRNMRKSATSNSHYVLGYGSYGGELMVLAAMPRPYPSPAQALNRLRKASPTEVADLAVSQDLILSRPPMTGDTLPPLRVIFKGNYAGDLNGMSFDPIAPGHPLSKRAAIKLMQAGLL